MLLMKVFGRLLIILIRFMKGFGRLWTYGRGVLVARRASAVCQLHAAAVFAICTALACAGPHTDTTTHVLHRCCSTVCHFFGCQASVNVNVTTI
jgi:hypothetical protein